MMGVDSLVAGSFLGGEDLDAARQAQGKASKTPLPQGVYAPTVRDPQPARFYCSGS